MATAAQATEYFVKYESLQGAIVNPVPLVHSVETRPWAIYHLLCLSCKKALTAPARAFLQGSFRRFTAAERRQGATSECCRFP